MDRTFLWPRSIYLVMVALAALGSCSTTPTRGQDKVRATEAGDESDDVFAEVGMEDDGSSTAVAREVLDGTSWTLRFGGGPDGEVVLVDGFPITLNFDGNTIGGTAACNGYGGAYTIDGNRFSINDLGWNEMGCQPDVQASEQAYLAALIDVEAIDLAPVDASPEGRGQELALSGGSSELIFEANAPVPSGELIDGEPIGERPVTVNDDGRLVRIAGRGVV